MPLRHHIDHARRRMETVAEGAVTWQDLQEHWAAELADNAEGYPELVDGSRAVVEFTSEDVRRMVELLRQASLRQALGPTAVVVRTDLGYGMIRMFGLLVEPFCEIVPFRDRATAESWLAAATHPSTEAR
jgi:hypothetical protein